MKPEPGIRYFRNKDFITLPDGPTIEPGSLWYLEAGHYVLVDDDQDIRIPEEQYRQGME